MIELTNEDDLPVLINTSSILSVAPKLIKKWSSVQKDLIETRFNEVHFGTHSIIVKESFGEIVATMKRTE